MSSFHRIKRESKILGFVGLAFIFPFAIVFMLAGFLDIEEETRIDKLRVILGLAGIAMFLVFIRGCWMGVGSAITHVLSITHDEIE